MCTYSMIADHYTDRWQRNHPQLGLGWSGGGLGGFIEPGVSRSEFEALKRKVADVKELLIKAKDYDARNGEPDCEMADNCSCGLRFL
jgi:hypothetical protein